METFSLSKKVRETAGSQNFFVTVITLLILTLNQNGAGIDVGAGEVIDEAVRSGNLSLILTAIFTNFLNPVLKIIRQRSWSWAFLKSPNFWTQIGTVVITALVALGIAFPDGTAAAIVNAIFSGDVGAIITAIVINVLNPLYHFFFGGVKGEKVRQAIP